MYNTVTVTAIQTLRTIAPFIVAGTCLFIVFVTTAFLSAPLLSHLNLFFVRYTYRESSISFIIKT